MSPAEQAILDRLMRRAGPLTRPMRTRFLASFDLVRGLLSPAELTRYLEKGLVEKLLDELMSDKQLDPQFSGLRRLIDESVLRGAERGARGLPAILRPETGISFDFLNPRVIESARALDTRVIQELKTDLRATVRQHAISGLEEGIHPRAVARGIRDVLELAPNQEAAVRNFERMLRSGDREALTRALRDRRFDRTLAKALGADGTGLSEAQIQNMTDAYRRGMVRFNAETHARTIALDTQRAAQRASWEDAITRGVVQRGHVMRQWIAVGGPSGDGRNRPEHLEMHGQIVGFDERFSNGQLEPGDTEWNCRCGVRYFVEASAIPILRAA